MTTPRHKSRTGFTLVELLIAMTVIAILAGLIAPAVFSALARVKESATTFEMKQIELALEQFKTDFGFYPPTVGANVNFEINSPVKMLAYLNRMAPQHAESSSSFPGSANSRLVDWWLNVGQYLDETTSLQFWLSGLCKNKQFPLTGGVVVDTNGMTAGTMTIAAYGVDKYSDGTDFPTVSGLLVVERNIYFDFKNSQLVPYTDPSSTLVDGAAQYQQAFGDSDGDLNYRYLDFKSYGFGAYTDGTNFFNPKSFQIVSYGRDGLPGNPGDVNNTGSGGSDNLTNFTNGRLDSYGSN